MERADVVRIVDGGEIELPRSRCADLGRASSFSESWPVFPEVLNDFKFLRRAELGPRPARSEEALLLPLEVGELRPPLALQELPVIKQNVVCDIVCGSNLICWLHLLGRSLNLLSFSLEEAVDEARQGTHPLEVERCIRL